MSPKRCVPLIHGRFLICKLLFSIIKQNIWFSVIIKVIALVLIFPGWLTLWMAVLSDTGAALIVILNAIRLLKFKE
jgi:Cd2+/Zn2+-exporting ATPase